MKTEVFHCKSDIHVRPMQFSILSTPTDSSDKTQMMCSAILLLCLFTSKYHVNGRRLNYSTASSSKFKYINMYCKSCSRTIQNVISVALKTPLKIRLGISIFKTSLLHRPDDNIGFTSSCVPPYFTTKLPQCPDKINAKTGSHFVYFRCSILIRFSVSCCFLRF